MHFSSKCDVYFVFSQLFRLYYSYHTSRHCPNVAFQVLKPVFVHKIVHCRASDRSL